ncbi:MAG: L,D-transpeptidase [Akkermansiaceae bacterium]|nr:L,D-transpeptidase [Akkermansiaceae bacterium]NNM30424.1 L,D-transpeptidase [Akkermansiaceae bacterium]
MPLRLFLVLLLVLPGCATMPGPKSALESGLAEAEAGIAAQRRAGVRNYDPSFALVVDPAAQRMHVVSLREGAIVRTLRCGTGKRGLGFGSAQTPPGFYTMGGVRIARNADCSIQTGDRKKGVAGIYAEILYPPSHPDGALRGRVPNNIVIHSYNPDASAMLRERRDRRLVGKIPCTTGCPVPEITDAPALVPWLQAGAGRFDPDSRPNAILRSHIASGRVREYSRNDLGVPVVILNRQ